MNEQLQQASANTTEDAIPAGYERREVIWPGTNERISVLMPIPTGWVA